MGIEPPGGHSRRGVALARAMAALDRGATVGRHRSGDLRLLTPQVLAQATFHPGHRIGRGEASTMAQGSRGESRAARIVGQSSPSSAPGNALGLGDDLVCAHAI